MNTIRSKQITYIDHQQDGSTVLVHGSSRVVVALLLKAAETKQFNVMVTEGRPNEDR